MVRSAIRVACLLAAVLLAGCGGDRGPQRVLVSGTVTHNGKPIANGMIRFVPVQASSVPASGAFIVDGKYTIDSHGGVPVGTHKIQIEAYRPSQNHNNPGARQPPNGPPAGLPQQYLSEKHNVKSQLEITLDPADRKIEKNIDLVD
jgi:hypothetical protein